MKKIILSLSFLTFGHLFSQIKFESGIYCEKDTSFTKGFDISKSVNVKSLLIANSNSKLTSSKEFNGKITGLAFNRLGSTFQLSPNNISGIGSAALFVSSVNLINGFERGAISKVTITTKRIPDIDTAFITKMELLQDSIVNKHGLLGLNDIKLGYTSFNTANSRGNLFATESIALNNEIYFQKTGDSTKLSKITKIGGGVFPSDNTDYQNLLGDLEAYQNSGWIVEIDRVSPNLIARRYDLGRAKRKDVLIVSERTSTNPLQLSKVVSSYQLIGDTASIILKSELSNGVMTFYVFDETAKDFDYWLLLNDKLSGNVQPLSKEKLLDLYSAAIEKGGTLFSNLTSITSSAVSDEFLIAQGGGKFASQSFVSKKNAKLSKLLEKYDDGTLLDFPNGNIVVLDALTSAVKELNITGSLGNGKYLSNIADLSWYSFGYTDTFGSTKSVNFLIIQENITENNAGQNPTWKTQKDQIQNEIYSVQLSQGESIVKSNIKLLATSENGKRTIIPSYPECYIPLLIGQTDNNFSKLDEIKFTEGYAAFFSNPVLCSPSNGINDNNKLNTFQAYPNPISLSGNAVLNFSTTLSGELYNMLGEKLLEFSNTDNLKIDSLNPGLYFIQSKKIGSVQIVVIP